MVNKAAIHVAAVAVYLATVTLSGVAQTSFAALGGKVTDEQGGVLPGVTVTVRQLDTNTTRTGVTESNGQYYLPSLPAGRYELTMELAGFGPAKREIVLRVGQEATLDVGLTVGARGRKRPRQRRECARRNARDGRQPHRPSRDRQFANHRPRLRRPREAGAGCHLERPGRDGVLRFGPAPVPEQRVRRRRE